MWRARFVSRYILISAITFPQCHIFTIYKIPIHLQQFWPTPRVCHTAEEEWPSSYFMGCGSNLHYDAQRIKDLPLSQG